MELSAVFIAGRVTLRVERGRHPDVSDNGPTHDADTARRILNQIILDFSLDIEE